MKRVVDASVGFKWAVIEVLTDKARKLRDDFRQGLVELLAPDVFPIEVATASRGQSARDVSPRNRAASFSWTF